MLLGDFLFGDVVVFGDFLFGKVLLGDVLFCERGHLFFSLSALMARPMALFMSTNVHLARFKIREGMMFLLLYTFFSR